MRDRLFINVSYRDSLLKECDEKNILGFHMLEAKDIFLLAAALGLNEPRDIGGKRDGYFRTSYIKTIDKALMASILLGIEENKDKVDTYANPDINYDEAERCAEAGFIKLKEMIDSADGDMELLEKRILSQLNLLYQKNVATNL